MKPGRNKLKRYVLMKTSESLAPYLPETRKMKKSTFWNMISKFGTVFLKPIRGRRGKGIIKITAKGDHLYEIHTENNQETVRGEEQTYAHIKEKIKSRGYMVQQPVHLTEINGCPMDFGVIVQRRNLDEPWTVTAKVVKVAGKGYIVTNNARSTGTILTVEEAIPKSSLKKLCQEELLSNIERIALLAAEELTKHYPYHRIYECDIGVEPDGKIMIIEANSKPMLPHFRKLKDKTMYQQNEKFNKGLKEVNVQAVREGNTRKVKRNILHNSGPATTTDSVKCAQVIPDICPREAEFEDILTFISTELTCIVGDPGQYTTVLFEGSGTAAVESILSSVIPSDSVVLIINNGAYGQRMCQIAKIYGFNVLEFQSPPNAPIDLTVLETLIQKSSLKISHLAVVHHETKTGLLNDIESIGKICKRQDVDMIVDAISSFAAIPIDMQKMNISYLAASLNKNIQGMPGISFVIAEKSTLEKTKHIAPRNYYLHLYDQYQFFAKTSQFRFTPSVQTLYALKQAIIKCKKKE